MTYVVFPLLSGVTPSFKIEASDIQDFKCKLMAKIYECYTKVFIFEIQEITSNRIEVLVKDSEKGQHALDVLSFYYAKVDKDFDMD